MSLSLTAPALPAYFPAVAEKEATGISLLKWSGDSRTAFALRLFCRLGASSFGRPGGRGRKARRCSTGKANSRSVALPISLGLAVTYRNWSTTMENAPIGASAPAVFNFNSHEVRIIDRNGEPWFVAVDVCNALGYLNTSKAIGDHLDADEKANESLGLAGSPANIISESGLYALVLRSRKPEARKFAKWVTAEVLPALRKTGAYAVVDRPAVSLRNRRWLVCFDTNGIEHAHPIPADALFLTDAQIIEHVEEPGGFPIALLPKLLSAVSKRLSGVLPAPKPEKTA